MPQVEQPRRLSPEQMDLVIQSASQYLVDATPLERANRIKMLELFSGNFGVLQLVGERGRLDLANPQFETVRMSNTTSDEETLIQQLLPPNASHAVSLGIRDLVEEVREKPLHLQAVRGTYLLVINGSFMQPTSLSSTFGNVTVASLALATGLDKVEVREIIDTIFTFRQDESTHMPPTFPTRRTTVPEVTPETLEEVSEWMALRSNLSTISDLSRQYNVSHQAISDEITKFSQAQGIPAFRSDIEHRIGNEKYVTAEAVQHVAEKYAQRLKLTKLDPRMNVTEMSRDFSIHPKRIRALIDTYKQTLLDQGQIATNETFRQQYVTYGIREGSTQNGIFFNEEIVRYVREEADKIKGELEIEYPPAPDDWMSEKLFAFQMRMQPYQLRRVIEADLLIHPERQALLQEFSSRRGHERHLNLDYQTLLSQQLHRPAEPVPEGFHVASIRALQARTHFANPHTLMNRYAKLIEEHQRPDWLIRHHWDGKRYVNLFADELVMLLEQEGQARAAIPQATQDLHPMQDIGKHVNQTLRPQLIEWLQRYVEKHPNDPTIGRRMSPQGSTTIYYHPEVKGKLLREFYESKGINIGIPQGFVLIKQLAEEIHALFPELNIGQDSIVRRIRDWLRKHPEITLDEYRSSLTDTPGRAMPREIAARIRAELLEELPFTTRDARAFVLAVENNVYVPPGVKLELTQQAEIHELTQELKELLDRQRRINEGNGISYNSVENLDTLRQALWDKAKGFMAHPRLQMHPNPEINQDLRKLLNLLKSLQ